MRPRTPSAAVSAADTLYVPEDDPRTLRLAVAVAVALHALLLLVQLPRIAAEEIPPPERAKVFVVQSVRFKPPEVAPVQPIRPEKPFIVPVPDPTPDEPEPLRVADTLRQDLDLPPTDLIYVPDVEPPPLPPQEPLKIGGDVSAPVRLSGPDPVYPEIARRAHLNCTVQLHAVIDPTGDVRDLSVRKPCPFGLSESALTAVRDWKYRPAVRRGLPVPVFMEVTVRFTLDG